MKTTISLMLLITALGARAETARWPLRIVETTYTVALVTGTEYNHQQKEKTSVVAVDINKYTENDISEIRFKRRFTKSMSETASETGSAAIPFEDKDKLLAAMVKAKTAMSRPVSNGDAGSEELYKGGTLTAALVTDSRKRHVRLDFDAGVGFELLPQHVGQFIDLLKRIK